MLGEANVGGVEALHLSVNDLVIREGVREMFIRAERHVEALGKFKSVDVLRGQVANQPVILDAVIAVRHLQHAFEASAASGSRQQWDEWDLPQQRSGPELERGVP